MSDFKYQLGAHARDLVTKITGIIVSRQEHLNGCNRYVIEQEAKDGKAPDMYSFDEARIELTGTAGLEHLAYQKQQAATAGIPARGGPSEAIPAETVSRD